MKKGLPWTLARTCAGEAYQCVAEEIESSSFVNSRGMLFLHFDVAMSPCEMSRRFQVERVGTYEELANTTSAKLDECNSKKLNCRWRYWDAENKTKTQIFNALASLLDLLNQKSHYGPSKHPLVSDCGSKHYITHCIILYIYIIFRTSPYKRLQLDDFLEASSLKPFLLHR